MEKLIFCVDKIFTFLNILHLNSTVQMLYFGFAMIAKYYCYDFLCYRMLDLSVVCQHVHRWCITWIDYTLIAASDFQG